MRRSAFGLCFGIGSVMASGLAFAQSHGVAPAGARFLHPQAAAVPDRQLTVDEARNVAARFGECVARSNRKATMRAVSYFPTDAAANAAVQHVAMPDCIQSGSLRMRYPAIRGALFIGLYRRDYGLIAPPAPAQRVNFAEGMPGTSEAADAAVALRQYVDCVVRSDGVDARAIILASAASAAETSAYAGLAPHLDACLTGDTQVKFSKTMLSGLIAEVAYRNAGASPNKSVN